MVEYCYFNCIWIFIVYCVMCCNAGTQMYRRFSSQAFEPCMEPDCPSSLIYTAVMSEGQGAAIPTSASVNALLDSKMMMQRKAQTIRPGGWSQTIRPFTLPYGMDIVLGDVCGGSSSTSMVCMYLCIYL